MPALDCWQLFPALTITCHPISIGHTQEFAGLYTSSKFTLARTSVVSDMHTPFSPCSAELHLCVESHDRTIAVASEVLVMDPVRLPFLQPTRRSCCNADLFLVGLCFSFPFPDAFQVPGFAIVYAASCLWLIYCAGCGQYREIYPLRRDTNNFQTPALDLRMSVHSR